MAKKLLQDKKIQKGLEFLKLDEEKTLQQQIKICEVPSPTFKEEKRAQYYYQLLLESGVDKAEIDDMGNVKGVLRGTEGTPKTITLAHIDTIFPEDTDVTVKERDGILYAPGLSDNSSSLAAQLSVIRAIKHADLKLKGDIVFTANVCEEGLGDLKGAKFLFDNESVDYSVVIDGTSMGIDGIVYRATGSKRYEINIKAEGGHSFNDFGKPSAIHALGRAIAKISHIEVSKEPKTTFNVGVIRGGTTVNTIASEASMLIDMRSNDAQSLAGLEDKIIGCVKETIAEVNSDIDTDTQKLSVDFKKVGDRPAGSQDKDSQLIKTAKEVTQALGIEPSLKKPSSTDANVPISKGIPAISISGGGIGGNVHTEDEWFDPTDAFLGAQRLFLLLASLAKLDS
ncbi:M20/M25/M40 family metallo-hydrolase [Proteinivorax hydrogeniformans]|uniref:M20/M25/M40 family metallo-hydrolase n=1 Tax=Proteinivorax hydrogeniformans TaxID=1826727 RepID=A0AAU8HVL7_9FIRM